MASEKTVERKKEKTLKIESQSAHNNNEDANELGAYILGVQNTPQHPQINSVWKVYVCNDGSKM